MKLAIDACWAGQGATTALNAANELAVAAFLDGQIGFMDIYRVNADVLAQLASPATPDLDSILALDDEARRLALHLIRGRRP